MTAYYNDNDPYCAAWLRNLIKEGLIPHGDVDDRDIRLVEPRELRGYRQVHMFAGLGGWPLALRLAGWREDREVWTGSCPCQPFSSAGKRKGFTDERHLWPEWFRLIQKCEPSVIFGEQVARAVGLGWLDTVADDLEGQGYAFGTAVLPACALAAPHERERLWFVANASGAELRQQSGRSGGANGKGEALAREYGETRSLADASAPRLEAPERETVLGARGRQEGRAIAKCCGWPAEPDVGRVAHGVPARVAKLRTLGNAIVPQVAAEFIKAFAEYRA